ncbi:MAG: hypothetical protein Q4A54_14615 [Parabacteroides sp.]|nr:hypothetical protein [Parabacteroides sp.]
MLWSASETLLHCHCKNDSMYVARDRYRGGGNADSITHDGKRRWLVSPHKVFKVCVTVVAQGF